MTKPKSKKGDKSAEDAGEQGVCQSDDAQAAANSTDPVMLPSRAIGNFLFPNYEVVITSLLYSSALMSERIKCSIPLVDNHINIHRAIHAVC